MRRACHVCRRGSCFAVPRIGVWHLATFANLGPTRSSFELDIVAFLDHFAELGVSRSMVGPKGQENSAQALARL